MSISLVSHLLGSHLHLVLASVMVTWLPCVDKSTWRCEELWLILWAIPEIHGKEVSTILTTHHPGWLPLSVLTLSLYCWFWYLAWQLYGFASSLESACSCLSVGLGRHGLDPIAGWFDWFKLGELELWILEDSTFNSWDWVFTSLWDWS